MKYFNHCLPDVKKQLRVAGGYILISDFDGTLAPIARTAVMASLPKETKGILVNCLKFFPVVIVSGRSLSSLKEKVGLAGLIYAGNHGLEWQIGGKSYRSKISKEVRQALATVKRKLLVILSKYPGATLEDKRMTYAIHFRMLREQKVKKFEKEVEEVIKPVLQDNLALTEDNKTFELRPKAGWTKGDFVNFILEHLRLKSGRRFLPIYIGDALTDEDVFKNVKNIVGIKVGKDNKSAARYYIRNQKQVNEVLRWLVQEGNSLGNPKQGKT